ncbi:histidine phosphatase family protein [soil metagenome]
MTTLYIVRHGETEWNTQKLLQGHTDSPLTEKGIEQAKESAAHFKTLTFDAAFSSDLLRAKRTAEFIALEHNLVVTTTNLMRERNFGKYEGRLVSEFRADLREMITDLSEAEKRNFKLTDDMESDEEVISRLLTFLRQTALAYDGKNVLIVTHSGVIRLLLTRFGYVTQDGLDGLSIKNLAYIKLDCDGSEFFIRDTHNIIKQEYYK